LTGNEIPPAARGLIDRHIHSVEQLEVLLLLRAAPDKTWTAAEVARALVTQVDSAGQRLADLEGRKLAKAHDDAFRYCADAAMDRAVGELAEAYATRRTRVVAMIFSKPGDAILGFSEAFRFRKGD
jgi:predicted secreted protein